MSLAPVRFVRVRGEEAVAGELAHVLERTDDDLGEA